MAPEGLAIGDGTEFTLADAAVIPFFGRMEVSLKRFARWKKYWDTAKARESFKTTFDEDYLTKSYSTRWTRALSGVSATLSKGTFLVTE
ncbi:glutathione S-transferase C-terminal-like protein [Lentinula edodes]|uniref:Glutathione S-transferase C-terminal-like protein n=1 Tax=Lentinula edodes TaxID=5353 RepID=A0A1Q3EHY3_LENED|nr:glutathione S-transferase C-terminal-like protein [Lentinula edodes]